MSRMTSYGLILLSSVVLLAVPARAQTSSDAQSHLDQANALLMNVKTQVYNPFVLEQEPRAANPSLEVVPVAWRVVSTNEIRKPRDRRDPTALRRADPPVDVLDCVECFVEQLCHGSIERRRPEMRYEVRSDHVRDISLEDRTRKRKCR